LTANLPLCENFYRMLANMYSLHTFAPHLVLTQH